MNNVYIGKIVNTHGIKGELRILSNFPYKDKVFNIGNKLIIDDKEYEIKSYRAHKKFDMVTLDDYHNINDVLFLLKKDVYIRKDYLNLSNQEILDEELLEYKVLTTKGEVGIIVEVFWASANNRILRVKFDKEILIPFNSPLIKGIDKYKKYLKVELLENMK